MAKKALKLLKEFRDRWFIEGGVDTGEQWQEVTDVINLLNKVQNDEASDTTESASSNVADPEGNTQANPSIQCSVCGQWKRLHGKGVQRFYSCCGPNGEYEHLKPVCDECCKNSCPYRIASPDSSKKTIQLDVCIVTSHLTEEQAILKIIEALGEEIVITPANTAQKEADNGKAVDIDSLAEEVLKRFVCLHNYNGKLYIASPMEMVLTLKEMYLKGKGEDQWISVETEPEFGGEYNVLYDLQDGGTSVVSTMDYDKNEKQWYDTRGANIVIETVLMWKELPPPPADKDLTT